MNPLLILIITGADTTTDYYPHSLMKIFLYKLCTLSKCDTENKIRCCKHGNQVDSLPFINQIRASKPVDQLISACKIISEPHMT